MAQKFTVPITVKQLTSTGSDAVTIYVDLDTYARLQLEAGGRLTWGSGAAAGDTNLYRDSANVLKTDDTFKAPILFIDDIEVDTTGAITDQVLKFNGTKFAPGTASTVGSIDDLSDVTISSASVGQTLVYNGSAWVNDVVVQSSSVSASDTAPVSPAEGDLWFESDTAQTYIYYDSQWIEIGASPGVASVSESAPSSPAIGQLWFDSNAGATNIYYDSQWIEVGGGGTVVTVSDTAPASPALGQVWFNSSDGGTYVYYNSNWAEIGAVPPGTLNTVVDAKGDLLVGTAADTLARLATGTANQVLTVDTSTATGLKWSTPTVYQAVVANVSDTEIGYLDGVSSAIQTQLNTKASTGKSIAMAIVFG